jgi:hypothetical protein
MRMLSGMVPASVPAPFGEVLVVVSVLGGVVVPVCENAGLLKATSAAAEAAKSGFIEYSSNEFGFAGERQFGKASSRIRGFSC